MDLEKMEIEDIKALGLNPDAFTSSQRQLILEPSWAPENYYCDGEITAEEADASYLRRLRASGLSEGQVQLIIKRVLG